MKEFTVLVPAYNEEKGIGELLDAVKAALNDKGCSYELLVVDDNSQDKTHEICQEKGARLIKHPTNRGYGASLKTGIRNAKFETIVTIDADGTYDPKYISQLVEQFESGGMVVGSRKGSQVHIPWLRRPAKWVLNMLANYLSGMKIPDLNSGLRIFERSEAFRYFYILPDGFSFTTTITLAMAVKGALIKYIPINYYKRQGKSKINPIRDTINFTILIIRTVLYFDPLKVFIPLSFIFASLGILLLTLGYFVYSQVFDATFAIFMLAALQVFLVGMLADLIDKRLVLDNTE